MANSKAENEVSVVNVVVKLLEFTQQATMFVIVFNLIVLFKAMQKT